jgi:hypothetical protein
MTVPHAAAEKFAEPMYMYNGVRFGASACSARMLFIWNKQPGSFE